MTLAAGARFEHYEVVATIGAGGMGEVYRARDAKLGRDVAFKVLPEAFALDPDRLARFHREAQVLAALNHPNIAQIYGVVDSGGISGIVMELVEGETLQMRLTRGPIPLDQTLHIARQVIDALETAHGRGIVHRDLKPGNIMISDDGTVKVLDFGLASRETEPHGTAGDVSHSPTTLVTRGYSQATVLIGTAAYMSPEQVRGRRADERSDIWAFGCVLYEMLTGRQAFTGETITDVLGGILKVEPDWNALPASVPPGVRALLKRCLEKDRRRFYAIGDFRVELEDALTAAPAVTVPAASTWRNRFGWIAAGLCALTMIAVVARGYLTGSATAPLFSTRFEMEDHPGVRLPPQVGVVPTVSPDGKYIAFVGNSDRRRLFLRPIGSLSAQPIAGTEGAGEYPFWSPRSDFKVAVPGGTPVTSFQTAAISCTSAGHRSRTANCGLAHWIPARTRVSSLFPRACSMRSRHLLFLDDRTLVARRFDADGLRWTGDAVTVAEDIAYSGPSGNAAFSVSDNGTLVYRLDALPSAQFAWFDRTGNPLGTVGEPANYSTAFDLSRDGKQIAVSRADPATNIPDVWLIDSRGISQKLTSNTKPTGQDVVWSPDGRQGARNMWGNPFAIVATNASGGGEETPLLASKSRLGVEDWSMDGRYLAYVKDDGTSTNVWASALTGERKDIQVTKTGGNEPHFSPDSRWLAYGAEESKAWHVDVVSFPALDHRCRVAKGGSQPRWRKDGRELYFLAADGKLMAVNFPAGDKMDCTRLSPSVLFDTGLTLAGNGDQYAVDGDGRRFLVRKPQTGTTVALTIVQNWDADLPK